MSDSEKCLINRYQTLLVYLLSDKESSIDRKSLRSEVCNFLVIAHYYYQGEPASSEIRRTLIALMDRHEKERKIEGILSDYIKDLVGDGEKIAIERRLRFLGFEGEALAKIIEDIEKNKMSDFSNWAITGDLE